ncbi:MAG: hypothetical protein Q8Q35_04735 [Nanoarchaeota archaeon]|nr:hypothetical protein [Nanoarchaeota archaeon]
MSIIKKGVDAVLDNQFLVYKALFMIFLIVSLTFMVSDLEVVSAANGCCEETSAGDTCVYTAEDNCVSDNFVEGQCEGTSFCEIGCCVADGLCAEGAGKATCDSLGGEWTDGFCAEQEECGLVCCQAGSIFDYTTIADCDASYSEYDFDLEYHDVNSYEECKDLGRAEEKGCCVSNIGCGYVTYEECEVSGLDLDSGYGFYEGDYCSDVSDYLVDNDLEAQDDCVCESGDHTECSDDNDVYSFDSCGNEEGVVEECDILYDVCSDASGEAKCVDAGCDDTFDGTYASGVENTHDSKIGNRRENGEQWCLYEGPAGGWFDRVGTEHYVASCLYGEEVITECGDYREKFCIQIPFTGAIKGSIFLQPEDYSEELDLGSYYTEDRSQASCYDNGVYDKTLNQTVTSVTKGGQFWESSSPLYQEGVPEACATANQVCEVKFSRETGLSDWECVENCYCLTESYANSMAAVCSAMGDCGANYNIVEVYSEVGFSMEKGQDYVGHKDKNQTLIGLDKECIEEWENDDPTDDDARDCSSCNKRNYEDGNCEFISDATDNYEKYLGKVNSGVFGNLYSVSKAFTDVLASQKEYSQKGDIATAVSGGLAGLALVLSYGAYLGAATVGTAAAGTAASAGVILGSIITVGAAIPVWGWIVAAIALVVLAIITFTGEDESVIVSSVCSPWVAPQTGECELCDTPVKDGGLAMNDADGNILTGWECSEYKCKSISSSCQFIEDNVGSSRPKCVEGEFNIIPPQIIGYKMLYSDGLNELGFDDMEDFSSEVNSVYDFEKDHHFVINEKIPPYNSVNFNFELDEVGQCRMDMNTGLPSDRFSEMTYSLIDGDLDIVTNFTIFADSLDPSTSYEYFIRCRDVTGAGIDAIDFFTVRFETDEGDDIEAPSIDAVAPVSGSKVTTDAESVDVKLYLDEFAICKYSTTEPVDFENAGTEFSYCDTVEGGSSSGLSAPICLTTIPLEDVESATYYFLCEDDAGLSMSEAEQWSVTRTQPLEISQISPSGDLYYNDVTLQVYTAAGSDNGNAICSFKGKNSLNYVDMENSATTYHEQVLSLDEGDYSYDILCVDDTGNEVETLLEFSVKVDSSAAEVESLFYLGGVLYVITDEETICEYDTESFSYRSGTTTAGSGSTDHTFNVEKDEYHVICVDSFGNEMDEVVIDLSYLE